MADLVVGMAKSVVDGALTRAQAVIEEEGKLRQSAARNLVFITGEFEMMRSFLNVADTERVENPVVRTWVRQISDLAYDVEDCIEFVVHLDKRNRWWLRLLKPVASCVGMAPLPLDVAVDELDRLKARVEDVSSRNTRYSLISDSGSKLVPTAAQNDQQETSSSSRGGATAFNRLFEAASNTTQNGRQWDLTQLLTKENQNLRVISIWGATATGVGGGDLDMVSIAWDAYTDRETCGNFACRAWVKMMHPFDPHEFVRSLTAQFYTNSAGREQGATSVGGVQVLLKMDAARAGGDSRPLKDFERLVMENRFLVVLEDLSTMAEWDTIRSFFPKMKNGSCIILHTQHFDVASLSVGHPYHVLPLNQRSAGQPVYAFFAVGSEYEGDNSMEANNATAGNNGVSIISFKKKAAEKWIHEHPLVGRESELKDLGLNIVTARFRRYQVMSVWGIAGVGKSALVKYIFCHRILVGTLFEKYGWVDVSHPFNLWNFSRVLLSNLESGYLQASETADLCTMGSRNPIVKCRDILRTYKCLVVIDGLQSKEEWDHIQAELVSSSNCQNVFIAVTRDVEIATHCCRDKRELVFNVKGLEADTAFGLFQKGSKNDADNSMEANNAGNNGVTSYTFKKEAAKKWIHEHPLVGRESELKNIGHNLINVRSRRCQVMSVWGIAGVGKSVLVKYMFCHRILKGTLFQKYGWVDISHPFNLWNFSRVLLSNLDSGYLQASETADFCTMGCRNPIVKCRDILKTYKCLVVIDGLQSKEEWDLIQAELVSSSDRQNVFIAVTTDVEIATHCCRDKRELVFNLKGLEADTAFELFQKVSRKNETADLRELASICGGLPSLLTEIAGSFVRDTTEWKHALSTNTKYMLEIETNSEFDGLRGLFDWMDLYFRKCFRNYPDSLKPCILYLPIFPRNHLIRRRRLVRRWIAEGYCRDSHEESAEMTGEKQFGNLFNLSIIKHSTGLDLGDTRMVFYHVNSFFREYIISHQIEENNVFELRGSSALTTQRTGRHLLISESWVRDRIVLESIDFSRLLSLTVFGKWKSFFISESMKLLRVLDLEGASEVEYADLKNMMKFLCRLKFLSLRGCDQICHLPSSIGNLRQLQTLDVRHTSIVTLPKNITKLEKLQYIRVGITTLAKKECVKVPQGIRKLTALHTLGVVNVSASGTKTFLEELKKLTHLGKLGVSGINKNNSNKFFIAISALARLESLSIRLDNNNEGCLDGIPLPLNSLRSLKLYGLGDRLPNWGGQLTMVAKMDLEMVKLTEEDYVSPLVEGVRVKADGRRESTKGVIKILTELPGLCILRLRVHHLQDNVLDVSVITNDLEEDSFEKMKMFEIACSSSSRVTFGEKTMKHLEQLKVDCCSGSLLFGLNHLRELKEVLLKGSSYSDEALKTDLMTKLQNHPKSKKPALKLEELPSRR